MAIKRAIKAGDKSIISFKKMIKVGEVSQLLNKNNYPATSVKNGITFTNNEDGTITISGNSTTESTYYPIEKATLIINHLYYLGYTRYQGDHTKMEIHNGVRQIDAAADGAIFVCEMSTTSTIYIDAYSGLELNVTYTPQLFDLTEMFGAGHEPATVAEFRAKFPETYYPYQRAVLTVYNKVVRPCARKGEVVQLVDPTIFNKTDTVEGVTYTGNISGTVSASGTSTDISIFDLKTSFSDIFSDHKYLITGCPEGGSLQTYNLRYSRNGFGDTGSSVITSGANIDNFRIVIQEGTTVENLIFTPQLFDLTAMYGAGNEPKTLAEFRKDFPESYYPYSPIQTKNLFDIRKCTGLISSTLNNLSAIYFIKNLTQNSLQIRLGAFDARAYLREPIVLSAGTYTFSCDCDYDAINNRGGVHLIVGKKNEDNTRIVAIREGDFNQLHRLVITFTLTEETEIYLVLQGDGGPDNYDNLNNVFFNIQLEKGSVATDYVPHDYI